MLSKGGHFKRIVFALVYDLVPGTDSCMLAEVLLAGAFYKL